MKAIVSADWHLTNRPQDEYRWEIFSWISKQIVQMGGVDAVIIAGDLTQEKDNHCAAFVNRLVNSLERLSEAAPIQIIKGNHDYLNDPRCPFFQFLGAFERINYYVDPTQAKIGGERVLFLPHSNKKFDSSNLTWSNYDFSLYDYIIFHQALNGAKTSNGRTIEGALTSAIFDKARGVVLGGDQHIPQIVGNAIYAGAPYPIYFGDEFNPRVLLVAGGEVKSLKHPAIHKTVVNVSGFDELKQCEIYRGDQIKVTVEIPRSMFGTFRETRNKIVAWCESNDVLLCGLSCKAKNKRERLVTVDTRREMTMQQVLSGFCRVSKIDDTLERVGQKILGDAVK